MRNGGVRMKFLAKIRKEKGLTQLDLTELSGVGSNSIARYERNEMKPSIETAEILAKALNVTVDELLNGSVSDNWELKILIKKEGTVDMSGEKSSAVLNIGYNAMAITLSAGYELWEDDAKFEALIEDLRKKRATGLRTRKESW